MPVLVLLVACAAWGLSYPLTRVQLLQQAEAGPSWILAATNLALRFGLAALLAAWVARRELARPRRGELAQALGIGGFTAGAMLCQIDALAHADAASVAFLSQGYLLWIPLVQALHARAWPAPRTLACAGLALLGLALIAGIDPRELRLGRGQAEALLGSLLFTAQILWVERPRYAGNRVPVVGALAFAVAALAIAPVLLLAPAAGSAALTAYLALDQLLILLVLGAVCTGWAMLLMFRYQPAVGAAAAGVIYATEPLWALAFALLLPGLLVLVMGVAPARDPVTAAILAGGALVVAANIALHLPWRRRRLAMIAAGDPS